MKKLIFCLSLMWILPSTAEPQTTSPAEEEKTYDLALAVYKQQLDLLEIQNNLLHALLQVPFDKRVYVYPALFESKHIAKKIVTHPQIAVWKGKKPTRIAPQMQEFAKKHLDYMPAMFYPFLDPDGWPKETKEGDWHNVAQMLPNVLSTPNNTSVNTMMNQIK